MALQGLAVAHALSRGLKMRPLITIALYALLRSAWPQAKYTPPFVLRASGSSMDFLKLRSRAALIASPSPTGPNRR